MRVHLRVPIRVFFILLDLPSLHLSVHVSHRLEHQAAIISHGTILKRVQATDLSCELTGVGTSNVCNNHKNTTRHKLGGLSSTAVGGAFAREALPILLCITCLPCVPVSLTVNEVVSEIMPSTPTSTRRRPSSTSAGSKDRYGVRGRDSSKSSVSTCGNRKIPSETVVMTSTLILLYGVRGGETALTPPSGPWWRPKNQEKLLFVMLEHGLKNGAGVAPRCGRSTRAQGYSTTLFTRASQPMYRTCCFPVR